MNPDLLSEAREAMIAEGFTLELSAGARLQLDRLEDGDPTIRAGIPAPRDLRSLPWSSVDNAESLDLDQVELVEPVGDDGLRLLIGIADVDHLVPIGSPLDEHAALSTTSVYT